MTPLMYEDRAELGKGKDRVKACTTGKKFRDVKAALTKYARSPIHNAALVHRRVIRLTIHILTEVGWTQGTCYRNAHGKDIHAVETGPPSAACFCLVGALDTAMDLMAKKYQGQDVAYSVSHAIYEALDNLYGKGRAWSRVTWNDNVDRTPEQVVSMLRAALQINL